MPREPGVWGSLRPLMAHASSSPSKKGSRTGSRVVNIDAARDGRLSYSSIQFDEAGALSGGTWKDLIRYLLLAGDITVTPEVRIEEYPGNEFIYVDPRYVGIGM